MLRCMMSIRRAHRSSAATICAEGRTMMSRDSAMETEGCYANQSSEKVPSETVRPGRVDGCTYVPTRTIRYLLVLFSRVVYRTVQRPEVIVSYGFRESPSGLPVARIDRQPSNDKKWIVWIQPSIPQTTTNDG